MAKLIRKYTADMEGQTKIATVYQNPDGSYSAFGEVEGVDAGPGAHWESNDLYAIIEDVKYWL